MVASTKSGQEQIEDRGKCCTLRGFPELVGELAQLPLPPDHRHHGFLWPVPHQAEETGDGDTSERPHAPSCQAPSRLVSGKVPGTHGQRCVLSWLCGLQVRVLELEKTLEAERVRLGELRRQHYVLAGVMGTPGEEEPSRPSPAPRSSATKKPPLAQKPSIAPRPDNQVPGISAGLGRRASVRMRVSAPGWCVCFWPHLLSPSSLTSAAQHKGRCLPRSACELLGLMVFSGTAGGRAGPYIWQWSRGL